MCYVLDLITGMFHGHNPSGRTVALGLNQPLTEVSTRNFFWVDRGGGGKGGRCVGMTLTPSCADCVEIREPKPAGTLRALQASNGIGLPFTVNLGIQHRPTKCTIF
jgi:hypothetical protein